MINSDEATKPRSDEGPPSTPPSLRRPVASPTCRLCGGPIRPHAKYGICLRNPECKRANHRRWYNEHREQQITLRRLRYAANGDNGRARYRSPEWRAKISRALKGRRLSNSTAGQFKKGHCPWNTGARGIRLSPSTEFKKGDVRGQAARNWKAIGAVVIRNDHGCRRRYVKLRDNPNDGQHNWRPLAEYLYRKFRGPIPPGHFVVHVDGNSLNDNLDNLMLMTRKGLPAWQRTIRPKMEPRRKAASARSQELRWRIYRAQKARAGLRAMAS